MNIECLPPEPRLEACIQQPDKWRPVVSLEVNHTNTVRPSNTEFGNIQAHEIISLKN